MAPQARSEATHQKILNAAIDLFGEVGYAAAGLGEIIERVGMTKGALYTTSTPKTRWQPQSSNKVAI